MLHVEMEKGAGESRAARHTGLLHNKLLRLVLCWQKHEKLALEFQKRNPEKS